MLADALDIGPIPLVIIEVLASNIGGAATLIGDPPNILIAGATGLSFVDFVVHIAPIAGICLVVVTPLVYVVYRDRLRSHPDARQRVIELDARKAIEDPEELRRAGPVLVLTILVFFVHKPLHVEPATVALGGATVLLFLTRQSVERALAGIEWPTLFFFLGLFVMVRALEERGAIQEIADGIASVTGGDRTAGLLGIAWVAAIGSGIVDNRSGSCSSSRSACPSRSSPCSCPPATSPSGTSDAQDHHRPRDPRSAAAAGHRTGEGGVRRAGCVASSGAARRRRA